MSGTGPARVFALLFGLGFVALGVWGFAETGISGEWADTTSEATVRWFQVNPLHNLVHVLVGAVLLAGGLTGEGTSRVLTLLVAVGYAVIGLGGFWATGADWNVLAVNTADNYLHLGTAVLGLVVVIASDRRRPARGRRGR